MFLPFVPLNVSAICNVTGLANWRVFGRSVENGDGLRRSFRVLPRGTIAAQETFNHVCFNYLRVVDGGGGVDDATGYVAV